MEIGLNGVIVSITVLLGIVVLAQVVFFQIKERKLNNIILGFTGWMQNQETINQAISAAVIELDTDLISRGILDKSSVTKYIVEQKKENVSKND